MDLGRTHMQYEFQMTPLAAMNGRSTGMRSCLTARQGPNRPYLDNIALEQENDAPPGFAGPATPAAEHQPLAITDVNAP